MYHRYTSREEGVQPSSAPRTAERIRNLLLILLAAACIVLAVFGGKAMSYQADSRVTFIRRMQTESNDALSMTSSLSRTAGANTSATLGRIRSRVYAADLINQLSFALDSGEGYLIGTEVFTNLYALLDEYSDKLITGTQTGDVQSALTTALTQLADMTALLD